MSPVALPSGGLVFHLVCFHRYWACGSKFTVWPMMESCFQNGACSVSSFTGWTRRCGTHVALLGSLLSLLTLEFEGTSSLWIQAHPLCVWGPPGFIWDLCKGFFPVQALLCMWVCLWHFSLILRSDHFNQSWLKMPLAWFLGRGVSDMGASQMAQWVKNLPEMQEMPELWAWSLSWEDLPEEEMATHSSTLDWETPRMEELVGYSPTGPKDLAQHIAQLQTK